MVRATLLDRVSRRPPQTSDLENAAIASYSPYSLASRSLPSSPTSSLAHSGRKGEESSPEVTPATRVLRRFRRERTQSETSLEQGVDRGQAQDQQQQQTKTSLSSHLARLPGLRKLGVALRSGQSAHKFSRDAPLSASSCRSLLIDERAKDLPRSRMTGLDTLPDASVTSTSVSLSLKDKESGIPEQRDFVDSQVPVSTTTLQSKEIVEDKREEPQQEEHSSHNSKEEIKMGAGLDESAADPASAGERENKHQVHPLLQLHRPTYRRISHHHTHRHGARSPHRTLSPLSLPPQSVTASSSSSSNATQTSFRIRDKIEQKDRTLESLGGLEEVEDVERSAALSPYTTDDERDASRKRQHASTLPEPDKLSSLIKDVLTAYETAPAAVSSPTISPSSSAASPVNADSACPPPNSQKPKKRRSITEFILHKASPPSSPAAGAKRESNRDSSAGKSSSRLSPTSALSNNQDRELSPSPTSRGKQSSSPVSSAKAGSQKKRDDVEEDDYHHMVNQMSKIQLQSPEAKREKGNSVKKSHQQHPSSSSSAGSRPAMSLSLPHSHHHPSQKQLKEIWKDYSEERTPPKPSQRERQKHGAKSTEADDEEVEAVLGRELALLDADAGLEVSTKRRVKRRVRKRTPIPGMLEALPISLGPAQHSLMLRQLRLLKNVVHRFPSVKAELRYLLAAHAEKSISKENLYPRICRLTNEVQRELTGFAKKQKVQMELSAKEALSLSLAQQSLNGMTVIKYGRRGSPHPTRLLLEPSSPHLLHWRSKNGEKSHEAVRLANVTSLELGCNTPVFKKAHKKRKLEHSCCLSLVTPERTLDIKADDPIQRDWLVNSLVPLIAFAKEFIAAQSAPSIAASSHAAPSPTLQSVTASSTASLASSSEGSLL